jgi:phosphate transport system permease protein
MDVFIQQVINGLVLGSMYALIALGYTMVYGIINLINFAHGEVLMVAALTSWSVIGLMQESMPGLPGWLMLLIALVIASVVSACLNFTIEKIAYRPLRNSPKLAPLITAIGMSILLQTLAMIIWKPNYKPYPTLLPSTPFHVGGAVISSTQIMILGVTAISLAVLMWILVVLFSNGFAALDWNILTKDTPAPGTDGGGLRNAIVGSLLIVGLSVLVATPVGILAGIYLTEYGDQSKTAELTRFVTDIMLSAPSIVIGLFVYAIAVATLGGFSGYAGSLALALIAVPVVMRTTENMLRLVPSSLREAAFALGAPRWKVSLSVTLRAAKSGVITGVLLAIARISGETAPLLFTALSNQFYSDDMSKPMANLPVVIFQFAMSPYDNWVNLAWGGALLITMSVLGLNILARTFFREKSPV